jgi:uncharacterized protein (TIGR02186 family)
MRRILCLAFLVLTGLTEARPAVAQSLVFDLSSHHIAISAGFSGTDVLLYGTTEGEGDVIVVLRGPEMPVVVRRKTRVLGIWINTEQLTFSGVPAFYRVAASRPLDEIALPSILARHQVGLDYLRMTPSTIDFNADAAAFREGLVRNKERNEQFSSEIGRVAFLGPRLFRTRVYLPANVPSGSYTAEVLLVNNGQVIAAQTTPMFVEQTGIGAEVHDFAHRRAALYGIVTVLFALLAGWGAGVFFRRRV